jgi:hypothetical protein
VRGVYDWKDPFGRLFLQALAFAEPATEFPSTI